MPDVAELRTFLRALGVASFKMPEQVFAMASLPKNAAGKILKHEIRALLLAKTAQSGPSPSAGQ
jgi:non-ribosomal peptide synthetase component E (peptide arylation enzyme)